MIFEPVGAGEVSSVCMGMLPQPAIIGICAGGGYAAQALPFVATSPCAPRGAVVVQTRLDGFAAADLVRMVGSGKFGRASFARQGQRVEAGMVLIAPPRTQLRVVRHEIRLESANSEEGLLARFFSSLACAHGPSCAALLLAAGRSDGVQGLLNVSRLGGVTLAEAALPDAVAQQVSAFALVLAKSELMTAFQELVASPNREGRSGRDPRWDYGPAGEVTSRPRDLGEALARGGLDLERYVAGQISDAYLGPQVDPGTPCLARSK